MSKSSKAKSKLLRLQKKRAIKQANKARYAALRKSGENSKSIRFMRNSKQSRLANKIDHIEGKCGNIGCESCNNKFKLKKTTTVSLRFYLKYKKIKDKLLECKKRDYSLEELLTN